MGQADAAARPDDIGTDATGRGASGSCPSPSPSSCGGWGGATSPSTCASTRTRTSVGHRSPSCAHVALGLLQHASRVPHPASVALDAFPRRKHGCTDGNVTGGCPRRHCVQYRGSLAPQPCVLQHRHQHRRLHFRELLLARHEARFRRPGLQKLLQLVGTAAFQALDGCLSLGNLSRAATVSSRRRRQSTVTQRRRRNPRPQRRHASGKGGVEFGWQRRDAVVRLDRGFETGGDEAGVQPRPERLFLLGLLLAGDAHAAQCTSQRRQRLQAVRQNVCRRAWPHSLARAGVDAGLQRSAGALVILERVHGARNDGKARGHSGHALG